MKEQLLIKTTDFYISLHKKKTDFYIRIIFKNMKEKNNRELISKIENQITEDPLNVNLYEPPLI